MVFATRDAKSPEDWDTPAHEPVNALVGAQTARVGSCIRMEAPTTTDAGTSFSMLHQDLPRVPVHDLSFKNEKTTWSSARTAEASTSST